MKEPRFIPLVWSQTEQPVPASLKAKFPVVTPLKAFRLTLFYPVSTASFLFYSKKVRIHIKSSPDKCKCALLFYS